MHCLGEAVNRTKTKLCKPKKNPSMKANGPNGLTKTWTSGKPSLSSVYLSRGLELLEPYLTVRG